MSSCPNGEHRPPDTVGFASRAAKVTTGEIEDTQIMYLARRNSAKQGRAKSSNPEKRVEIAKKAANSGWGK